jgi:hypothetical protein
MPITDITKTVEEQVLVALSVAQEAVVDGVRQFAEAVEPVIPDVPRPFAAEASQLVDGAFTFAEKLLHNSHEFVGRLLDAADTSTTDKASASASAKPAAATKAGAK